MKDTDHWFEEFANHIAILDFLNDPTSKVVYSGSWATMRFHTGGGIVKFIFLFHLTSEDKEDICALVMRLCYISPSMMLPAPGTGEPRFYVSMPMEVGREFTRIIGPIVSVSVPSRYDERPN